MGARLLTYVDGCTVYACLSICTYVHQHLNMHICVYIYSLADKTKKSLISNRQTREMSETVSAVGVHFTDDDVNNLAARHLEDSQLMEVQWDSTISVLKEDQERDFKNFVMESFAGREITTPVTPKYVSYSFCSCFIPFWARVFGY